MNSKLYILFNSTKHLNNSFSDALNRYHSGMQEEFPTEVTTTINETDEFGAKARAGNDGSFTVVVNSASIQEIKHLWTAAWPSTLLTDDAGGRVKDVDGSDLTLEHLQHLSLTWLMLHELMHIRLGHLGVLGVAELVEVEGTRRDARSFEDRLPDELRNALSGDELKRFRPCLELQADNEATEILFGVFSEDQWVRFRIEAAAIFVVMALMDKAERRLTGENRIYPRVGTRFFTLFAQLFQYWLYPGADLRAGDGESFVRTPHMPDEREFERYMKAVLVPCIHDAAQIAMWAEVPDFLRDLGEDGALIRDIFTIQYAEDLAGADLLTPAARQWRELMPVNEKIMAVTGLRD